MHTFLSAASMLLAATVSAFAQSAGGAVPTDVLKDLAPTGKLRAAINLGNSVLAQADTATGQPKGITPDLALELGRRLGVPVEFVVYDAAFLALLKAMRGTSPLSRSSRYARPRSSSAHPMSSSRAPTWCQRILR